MIRRTDLRPFALVVPPAIWAACFLVVYASESLICGRTGSATAHATLVLVVGLLALASIAVLVWRWSWRARDGTTGTEAFHVRAGRALALLSLLATVWTLLPALMLPACSG
jgi:phosphoglycerol transferase MdoB-like AlkP superfamily enzyme